jgi:periplasmic protein TonB
MAGVELPEQADGAELAHVMDSDAVEDLPPHRAAVALPPVSAPDTTRSGIFRLGIMAAVALHVGFVSAALIWGQGEELPPFENAIAVELVETAPTSAHAQLATPDAEVSDAAAQAGEPANASETPDAPAEEAVVATEQAEPVDAGNLASSQILEEDEEPARPSPLAKLQAFKAMLAARSGQPRKSVYDSVLFPHGVTASTSEAEDDGYLPKSADRADDTEDNDAPTPSAQPGRSSGPSRASRMAMVMYKRRVKARISRSLPAGIFGSGRVSIGMRISRRGGLLSTTVLRSSGNPEVDRAALSAVRQAGPYPRPPAGASPRQLALSISFLFE